MGLFDFMDARRGIARWADKWFRECRTKAPNATTEEIALVSLGFRYRTMAGEALKSYISYRAPSVRTIHDLCYLVADAECLGMLDPFEHIKLRATQADRDAYAPVQETYRVIDDELLKLGYRK